MNAHPTLRLPTRWWTPALVVGFLFGCAPLLAQDLQQRAAAWSHGSVGDTSDEAATRTSVEVEPVRVRLFTPAAPLPGLDGRPSDELAGFNYRLWMSRGRTDLGIGVGSMGYLLPRSLDGPRSVVGAVPTVSLGLRYRMSEQHTLFADASGARGLGVDPGAAYLTTRVGMEWTPAKSSLGFAHGALGMQLDSGYRLSFKVRHGKPALYLRTQF